MASVMVTPSRSKTARCSFWNRPRAAEESRPSQGADRGRALVRGVSGGAMKDLRARQVHLCESRLHPTMPQRLQGPPVADNTLSTGKNLDLDLPIREELDFPAFAWDIDPHHNG